MPRKQKPVRICGVSFFARLFRSFSNLPSTASNATNGTRSIPEASNSEERSKMSSGRSSAPNHMSNDFLDWSNADAPGNQVEQDIRYPIEFLVRRWNAGEKEPLERLLRAFIKIKNLDADDRRSFTYIAGLHGKPFIKRPEVDRLSRPDRYEYWGGYCPHATILFPVWHRAYLDYLEKSLQQFEPGVMLAYWDEISEDSQNKGVPDIFTQDKVTLDGQHVDNPLKSFTMPAGELMWQLPEHSKDVEAQKKIERLRDRYDFSKPYTTIRFPLFHTTIGTDEAKRSASEANRRYGEGGEDATAALNKNVSGWLKNPNKKAEDATIFYTAEKYRMSLDVKEYTLFSCTTAMTFYKTTTGGSGFSLEGPHNDIHDACGFQSPPMQEPEQFAYGDIGTLETSSFDPLFWFHHCFVDRMFWYWQRLHSHENSVDVIEGYPGTRSSDGFGGPTVGQQTQENLTMKTPLFPFLTCACDNYLVGNDVLNIQNLGYGYKGSEETTLKFVLKPAPKGRSARDDGTRGSILVKDVDRTRFSGTFVVMAYIKINETKTPVGYETVFNRLIPEDCPGCMVHKMKTFVFPLTRVDRAIVYDPAATIEIKFMGDKSGYAAVEYQASFMPAKRV